MIKHSEFVDNVSFNFLNFDKIDFQAIRKASDQYNLAVIKNFIPIQEINDCKKIIKNNFLQLNDRIRQKGEYHKVMTNYQRLCVGYGESPASGEIRNSRLFRILFNPTFEKNIYGMRDIFKKLIVLRNLLYGINEKYCLEEPEGGVFSCSRIHQFPKGGGFLQLHRDKDAETSSKNAGLSTYLNPLIIFDKKGEDFKTGGGIIKYNDEIIFYEDTLEPGDLVIYNGKTEHGVYNIDQEEILNLKNFNGRSSILASLFKTK